MGTPAAPSAPSDPGSQGRPPSERTQVRRVPERGNYDPHLIGEILDEALICHLSYVDDKGGPRVIPTIHARDGDTLYLHGSAASRTIRRLAAGAEVSVAATIVDGIVFARAAFNHSMNYRSVVVYGTPRVVTEPDELQHASRVLADHVAHGRGADARMPRDDELKQTTIFALKIDEASAKVRTGPPHDDEDDLSLPVWAGVLPLAMTAGPAEPDPTLAEGIEAPGYVTDYRR